MSSIKVTHMPSALALPAACCACFHAGQAQPQSTAQGMVQVFSSRYICNQSGWAAVSSAADPCLPCMASFTMQFAAVV